MDGFWKDGVMMVLARNELEDCIRYPFAALMAFALYH